VSDGESTQGLPEPLTHKELDVSECSECGGACGSIILAGACHPHAAVWAEYQRGGTLVLYCADCNAVVVRIKVA
jgi:hypothetical protein